MSLLRVALSSLLLSACATACVDQTVERATRPAAAAAQEEPAGEPEATEATPPASPAPTASTPTPAPAPSAPACATTFGHSITAQNGRLDGVVRAVILPGDKQCKSDNDHVIVQVDVDGETYPAWVNVESNITTADPQIRFAQFRAPLAFGVWSEGWHPSPGPLDYPTTLGVHTSSFSPMEKMTAAAQIAAVVTDGAQVSVFFEGFATADGGHKVHRNGFGRDGALVVIEKTGQPRWLLFHFAQQSF